MTNNISQNFQDLSQNQLTIFIGIYNGSQYIDSLREQLANQTTQNFQLLVIDNCSTDTSWQDLQAWKTLFGTRISLHRNSTNLGGGGSMSEAISRDLINTPWFTLLHQDDYYLPNHVATIMKAIENSPENVVAVCTSMGSIDSHGNVKPTPPRAQWLVQDNSPVSSFLINLRTQTLSFPSAAFNYSAFKKNFGDWHSPTFSDTELTLKLCASGEFRYIQEETMRYRENPNSESHVINSLESSIGASLGLARVFTSYQFQEILDNVEVIDRAKFYSELISAVEVRLNESPLSAFIKLLATDECCKAWNFTEQSSTEALSRAHSSLDSSFTASLLARLSGINVPTKDQELAATLQTLSNQKAIQVYSFVSKNKSWSWLLKIWGFVPLRTRARIFRFYVHARAIKQPNFYWNSFWR